MAKKTDPKSIRFNDTHLKYAFKITGLKKEQELVDRLLEEIYEEGNPKVKLIFAKPREPLQTKAVFGDNIKVVKVPAGGFDSDKISFSKMDEAPKWMEPEIAEKQKILKQIADIEKESIPKERDTAVGRKVWKMDQQKRINELKKKL